MSFGSTDTTCLRGGTTPVRAPETNTSPAGMSDPLPLRGDPVSVLLYCAIRAVRPVECRQTHLAKQEATASEIAHTPNRSNRPLPEDDALPAQSPMHDALVREEGARSDSRRRAPEGRRVVHGCAPS